MEKEAMRSCAEIPSQYLHERTEEDHEMPQDSRAFLRYDSFIISCQ
jgi:hypothetical protein